MNETQRRITGEQDVPSPYEETIAEHETRVGKERWKSGTHEASEWTPELTRAKVTVEKDVCRSAGDHRRNKVLRCRQLLKFA